MLDSDQIRSELVKDLERLDALIDANIGADPDARKIAPFFHARVRILKDLAALTPADERDPISELIAEIENAANA